MWHVQVMQRIKAHHNYVIQIGMSLNTSPVSSPVSSRAASCKVYSSWNWEQLSYSWEECSPSQWLGAVDSAIYNYTIDTIYDYIYHTH